MLTETVKLFSLMAKADGVVSEEEESYVHQHFRALYREDFANFLNEEFAAYVKKDLDASTVARSLKGRLGYEEKIFLLVKLYELMASDEIEEAEMQLLNTVSLAMGVHEADLKALGQLLRPDGNLPPSNLDSQASTIRHLCLTDQPEDTVSLPFPGLRMMIIRVNRKLILIQGDAQNTIRLGDLKITPHFARLIRHEQAIRINESYVLTYQDLKYYFKHIHAPKRGCFLQSSGSDYSVSADANTQSFLEVELERCAIRIRMLNTQEELWVNGQAYTGWQSVNLDDLVIAGGRLINLRTLVTHPLLERELFVLSGSLASFQIGNQFEHDITIDDDLDQTWACPIEIQGDNFLLRSSTCPYPVYLNNQIIKKEAIITRDDQIRINNFIIFWNKEEQHFEKVDAGFSRFSAQGLVFTFKDKTKGVDDISFDVKRGELVGILGPSGSGKSTLLNLMNGFYKPQEGQVLIDNYDLHDSYDRLKDFIGYVPQDDLLLENLTVYENLYYNAQLRYPNGTRDINNFVHKVLRDIGLWEKRNVRVGSPLKKVLSGGERKRVNIGLELLSESDVLFLDEPTSGLSSKDSEKILTLVRQLAFRGKIIFVVIHQPSAKLYKMFNKIVLLDQGGRLAFFGNGFQALDYFKQYSEEVDDSIDFTQPQNVDPDILLDTLEQPLKDIDGKPLPVRKYSPDFWQEEYKNTVGQQVIASAPPEVASFGIPELRGKSFAERWSQFQTLFTRNFKNKLRDRSNLIITFLIPPLLGIIVGSILHYSRTGPDYTLYDNVHLVTFIFLAVLIAIFLGMTNSVEEIIRDQRLLLRERMLHLSHRSYFASKFITLFIFGMIQSLLFLIVSFPILELKELFFVYFILLTLVSMTGISIGLFISALPRLSSKAAVNLVPVILVPQIIFGGALVKYKEMNQQLKFFTKSPVPEVCQIMPSRWGFEAIVATQGMYNRFHSEEDSMQYKLDDFRYARKDFIVEQTEHLGSEEAANERYEQMRDSLQEEVDDFRRQYQNPYGNMAVNQAMQSGLNEYKKLVKAERLGMLPLFMRYKPLGGTMLPTPLYNSLILLLITVVISFGTLALLRVRFR